MSRLIRPLSVLALLVGLGLMPASVRGQGPNDTIATEPAAEESAGDPLYAYIGTALLASGAIFIVCKSARR
jgi:hypothetical protein